MTKKPRICVELRIRSQIAFCQTQYYHSFLDNAYDPSFQTENSVSESDPFRFFSSSPVRQTATQSVKQLSLSEQVSEPLCCVAVQVSSNRTCKVT